MGMSEAIQIQLLDHMGSDLTVVNAARVSFKKRSEWEFVKVRTPERPDPYAILHFICEHFELSTTYVFKQLPEKDRKLIRFLAREKHTTPFRHPQLQLWCKAPIFLARQLGKHQVGMSWNEVSRRYVDDEPEFYTPDCWRKRPEDGIKQGSSDECVDESTLTLDPMGHPSKAYKRAYQLAEDTYKHLLNKGVAPEMARMVLPQSMLTEWVWTGSLYAFFNVWKQRADGHAQKEAQFFAELLDKAVPEEMRFSWDALKEYRP